MAKKITQDQIDMLTAQTEHNRFLHTLLSEAIMNNDSDVVYAVMLDENLRMTEKQLETYFILGKEYAHTHTDYMILNALLLTPNFEEEQILKIMKSVSLTSTLERMRDTRETPEAKDMLERVMMRTPDEQTDIQIAFKETLDLNESLISATEDKDWDQVNEILDIDGFSLLSSQFTKAFPAIATSGEADLLIKLSQRPDFKLNPHTLSIRYSVIENLLTHPADRHLYFAQKNILKCISQSPCHQRITETLFKKGKIGILNFDSELLATLTLSTWDVNATFAYGKVPYYKPVMDDTHNYETLLTYAIKKKKWSHVRYFISVTPPTSNGRYIRNDREPYFVDFHGKSTNTCSAYSLLKKAAKKSSNAQYLLEIVQDRIAEQKAYKAENAQKKSLLHKMRLK